MEMKNTTLVDIVKTILIESNLPQNFWVEEVSTTCYVTNRCWIRSLLIKTPYELLNDKKSKISYLRPFGCNCFVRNNGEGDMGMFDPRRDERIFVGYSFSSKTYRVFNKRMLCTEKSVHVVINKNGNVKNTYMKNDDDQVDLFKL